MWAFRRQQTYFQPYKSPIDAAEKYYQACVKLTLSISRVENEMLTWGFNVVLQKSSLFSQFSLKYAL